MKRTRVITATVTTEEDGKNHFADLESVICDIVDVYRENGDVGTVVATDSENHLGLEPDYDEPDEPAEEPHDSEEAPE